MEIKDLSLEDYIGVWGKSATYLPHTAGRYQKKRFRKAQCPIVERLANSLMRKGRNNGKKVMANRIVKHTLEIIHLLTDQNPVQVRMGLRASFVVGGRAKKKASPARNRERVTQGPAARRSQATSAGPSAQNPPCTLHPTTPRDNRWWWTRSSTPVPGRTRRVWGRLAWCGGRPWTCPPSGA